MSILIHAGFIQHTPHRPSERRSALDCRTRGYVGCWPTGAISRANRKRPLDSRAFCREQQQTGIEANSEVALGKIAEIVAVARITDGTHYHSAKELRVLPR